MKTLHRIDQSFTACFFKGMPVLLSAAILLLTDNQAGARGFVAVGGRGAVAVGPRGAVAVGNRGAVAVRGVGYGVSSVRVAAVGVRPLPAGYIRVVPAGYRTVFYGGYNCFFVGGVYYRPEFYQGETVYVIVR